MQLRPASKLKAPLESSHNFKTPEAATHSHARCLLEHDLNNQLAIILAHCDLLRTRVSVATKGSQNVQAIRSAAECIAEIVTTHQCTSKGIAR